MLQKNLLKIEYTIIALHLTYNPITYIFDSLEKYHLYAKNNHSNHVVGNSLYGGLLLSQNKNFNKWAVSYFINESSYEFASSDELYFIAISENDYIFILTEKPFDHIVISVLVDNPGEKYDSSLVKELTFDECYALDTRQWIEFDDMTIVDESKYTFSIEKITYSDGTQWTNQE